MPRSLFGMLLLAGLVTQPVMAGWVYQLNTNDSLSWRIAGHALKLHSTNATGIQVTSVSAEPVWGLHEGDVIVAVGELPVKHVRELMDQLRASHSEPVVLHVLRGKAAQDLTVTAAEYLPVVSPSPPTPPTPPVPPSAPNPASTVVDAPSEMASGWYTVKHTSDDSLSWRIPDHSLRLTSGKDAGIRVTRINPDTLWGLRLGDSIVSVDRHPVAHVSEFVGRLQTSKPKAVTLQVRRTGVSLDIPLVAADYTRLLSTGSP